MFPTIWKKLEDMIKYEELISHQQVYKEIQAGKDIIYRWCKNRNNNRMFKDVDEFQVKEMQAVEKNYDKNYWENEISKPRPWADPWVIALSICENAIIVADEKDTPNRIPAISAASGVQCLRLLDFFKKIGIKY